MKGRQLENAAALGLSPDAQASQADLATAVLEQGQAAVRLGPHSALLREGDEGGGEGAVCRMDIPPAISACLFTILIFCPLWYFFCIHLDLLKYSIKMLT